MELFSSVCDNRVYRRIYSRGKASVSPLVVVYIMKNKTGDVRMGLTATKKIGNAVKRNRARRVLREAFRSIAGELPKGRDYILVARVKTTFCKSTELEHELRRLLLGAAAPGRQSAPAKEKALP